MKIRKRQSIPPTTPHSQGGFTSSRPGRFFKDLCKNLAYALLVIGLMFAIIALGMREIGEGRAKQGPLTVSHLSKEDIKARMKFHGTIMAYRCNRPSGWCFTKYRRGQARRGLARLGGAWCGMARQGEARRGIKPPKIKSNIKEDL